MDQQHAAEAVTDKGKVFKFDAVECMIHFREQQGDTKFAFLLVNDYHAPKRLIDAHSAQYLVSPALPSPMGAFLTAFESEAAAMAVLEEKGGETFDWEGIQQFLNGKGGGAISSFGHPD